MRHLLMSQEERERLVEMKRSPYRRWRERRAQCGELVQFDGSPHAWLGGEQKQCLMNMVDDATGCFKTGWTAPFTSSTEPTRGIRWKCFPARGLSNRPRMWRSRSPHRRPNGETPARPGSSLETTVFAAAGDSC